MCIRDRGALSALFVALFKGLRYAERARTAAESPATRKRALLCLLYTSGRCRRIERCPSRGLGDVYKRQGCPLRPVRRALQGPALRRAGAHGGRVARDAQARAPLSLIHIWTLPTNREVSVSWARRCV